MMQQWQSDYAGGWARDLEQAVEVVLSMPGEDSFVRPVFFLILILEECRHLRTAPV